MRAIAALLQLLAACSEDQPAAKPAPTGPSTIELSVTERGFEPTPVEVAKGQPVTLVVTRKTDTTCATDLTIPEHGVNVKLPLGQPVTIKFTPTRSGELRYGCSMEHMISGVLQVR
jgi:plastocyanin domain-containing protein